MKKVIFTDKAPAALGPYSQAVCAGGFVWMSGQIAIDPATGNVVEGGVEAETRQVLSNMRSVLAEAGLTPDAIVKTTVFLQNMDDFAKVNAIYGEFFTGDYPARSCVQVAALPKGVLVEIEAVAVCDKK